MRRRGYRSNVQEVSRRIPPRYDERSLGFGAGLHLAFGTSAPKASRSPSMALIMSWESEEPTVKVEPRTARLWLRQDRNVA